MGCLIWCGVESLQAIQTCVINIVLLRGSIMEMTRWEHGHFPTVSEIFWSSVQHSQHPPGQVSSIDIKEWKHQYRVTAPECLRQQIWMITFSILSKMTHHIVPGVALFLILSQCWIWFCASFLGAVQRLQHRQLVLRWKSLKKCTCSIHKPSYKCAYFKEHLRGKGHMELFCHRNTVGAGFEESLLITTVHVLGRNVFFSIG